MNFSYRSYSGKLFRPKPEIYEEPEGRLWIVATPWGPRSTARRAIQIIGDYFHAASGDKEVTSPYERMSCLTPVANTLRTATLIANEIIHREENHSEFATGVEIFAGAFYDQEFVWVQLGQPQLLLLRKNHPALPLGMQMDLANDLVGGEQLQAPLPGHLLGLDPTANLLISSLRLTAGDQLMLVSRSQLPGSVYAPRKTSVTLDQLSLLMSKENEDSPFWLGLLTLD